MKNSTKALALAIGVMLACSLALTASGAQEARTVAGVVKAVDLENRSLQITEDVTNQEYTFKVENTTVITKGDQTITLADVKTGDKVDVMLEQGKVKTVKVK
jgi:Cu/Ag efflux protein CusF